MSWLTPLALICTVAITYIHALSLENVGRYLRVVGPRKKQDHDNRPKVHTNMTKAVQNIQFCVDIRYNVRFLCFCCKIKNRL